MRGIIESCVVVPGIARHIPEFLDTNMDPDPRMVDMALAATLVSDSWVKEDGPGDVHHGSLHGQVAADHWRTYVARHHPSLDAETVEFVALGSEDHLGVYAPRIRSNLKPFEKPEIELSPLARLVNLCDLFTAQPALGLIYDGKKRIV